MFVPFPLLYFLTKCVPFKPPTRSSSLTSKYKNPQRNMSPGVAGSRRERKRDRPLGAGWLEAPKLALGHSRTGPGPSPGFISAVSAAHGNLPTAEVGTLSCSPDSDSPDCLLQETEENKGILRRISFKRMVLPGEPPQPHRPRAPRSSSCEGA